MKTDFEIAEEIFNSRNYIKAFGAFSDIAESSSSSNEIRSEAFNMMGVIVLFDPTVDPEDESGLKYFARSLDLNPFNVGALFNTIACFGLSISSHKNIEMLDYAIRNLQAIDYNFTDLDKKMIGDKMKIRDMLVNR